MKINKNVNAKYSKKGKYVDVIIKDYGQFTIMEKGRLTVRLKADTVKAILKEIKKK